MIILYSWKEGSFSSYIIVKFETHSALKKSNFEGFRTNVPTIPTDGYTSISLTATLVQAQISTFSKNRMTLSSNSKKKKKKVE